MSIPKDFQNILNFFDRQSTLLDQYQLKPKQLIAVGYYMGSKYGNTQKLENLMNLLKTNSSPMIKKFQKNLTKTKDQFIQQELEQNQFEVEQEETYQKKKPPREDLTKSKKRNLDTLFDDFLNDDEKPQENDDFDLELPEEKTEKKLKIEKNKKISVPKIHISPPSPVNKKKSSSPQPNPKALAPPSKNKFQSYLGGPKKNTATNGNNKITQKPKPDPTLLLEQEEELIEKTQYITQDDEQQQNIDEEEEEPIDQDLLDNINSGIEDEDGDDFDDLNPELKKQRQEQLLIFKQIKLKDQLAREKKEREKKEREQIMKMLEEEETQQKNEKYKKMKEKQEREQIMKMLEEEKQQHQSEEYKKQKEAEEQEKIIQMLEKEKQQKQKDEEKLLKEFLQKEKEQEELRKMEEEKVNKDIECVNCQDTVKQEKEVIFLDSCSHIYHEDCFQLSFKALFERFLKRDDIKKQIQDNNFQVIKMLVQCECMKKFNLFDYREHFESYKKIQAVRKANQFLCQLCFNEKDNADQRVLDCDHQFCLECLTKYVKEKHQKNEVYQCPACRKPTDELFIQDLIPEGDNQVDFHANVSDILAKDRMLQTALDLCNGDKEQAQKIVDDGNYLELGAVTQLDQCQKNALNHVARVAQVQSKKALLTLRGRFTKLGFPEEYVETTLKYIRDEAPITINFRLANLTHYLKDTHYRNLFEVNKGATHGPHGRFAWEQNLFNKCYDKAKPHQRVKYGALNIFKDPQGIPQCAGYGPSFFVMKEVRLRTSFYDRDTGGFPKNRYLATSQHYAHILNDYNDNELKTVIEIAVGLKHFHGREYKGGGGGGLFGGGGYYGGVHGTYKEIQIHGDVQFSKHIQCMFYDQNEMKQNKTFEKQVKEFEEKFKVPCMPILTD